MQYKRLPDSEKTFENTIVALRKYGFMWDYVPSKFKTRDTLYVLLRHHGWMIQYTSGYIDYELAMAAVSSYPFSIKHVPKWMMTRELANRAFLKDPATFPYIPLKYVTVKMCEIAVECSINLYDFVPVELKQSVKEMYELKKIEVRSETLKKIAGAKGNYRKRLFKKI